MCGVSLSDMIKKIILFVAVSGNCFAIDYKCPEFIETTQSLKGSIQADFETITGAFQEKQRLERISVYSGHPKDGGTLVPDNDEYSSKDPYWTFQVNDNRGVWMGCTYNNTTIILVRKFPTATTKCVLKYKLKPKRVDVLSCL